MHFADPVSRADAIFYQTSSTPVPFNSSLASQPDENSLKASHSLRTDLSGFRHYLTFRVRWIPLDRLEPLDRRIVIDG